MVVMVQMVALARTSVTGDEGQSELYEPYEGQWVFPQMSEAMTQKEQMVVREEGRYSGTD